MPNLKLTYKYDLWYLFLICLFIERKKNNITLNQVYSIQSQDDPIEEHVLKQSVGVS